MKTLKFEYLAIIISVLSFSACEKDKEELLQAAKSVSLTELRNLYQGSDYTLDATTRITGVVISVAEGNMEPGEVVIQNNLTGIAISLGTHALVVGDSIIVLAVKGSQLSRNSGTLKLTGGADNIFTTKISSKPKKPKVITLAELSANFSAYESTLVRVTADIVPTPVPGTTLGGTKQLDDVSAADDIFLHAIPGALVSGLTLLPAKGTFTGIAVTGDVAPIKQLRPQQAVDVTFP